MLLRHFDSEPTSPYDSGGGHLLHAREVARPRFQIECNLSAGAKTRTRAGLIELSVVLNPLDTDWRGYGFD